MTLTRQLLQDLLYKADDISDREYQAAKRGIIDFTASSLAAKNEPAVKQAVDYYGYSETGVPVTGYDALLRPKDAVLVNSYIAHYLDLDDVHSDIRGHPSAVLLPALFALKDFDVSNRRFYDAYILGVDLMAALGRNIGSVHYEKGFHVSSTLGGIASAFAVSYALGHNIEKTENALGIAVSNAGGLRSQFGSEMKPFQLGMAASGGFEAAMLSHYGIVRSNEDQIEAFLDVYGDFKEETIDVKASFAVTDPGLWFKLYPCCSANYHVIDALQVIIETYDIHDSDVAALELIYPSGGDAALVHQHPKTGKEGMFSPEYVCALLLTGRTLTPEVFSDQEIEPYLEAVMKKITRTYDDSIVPSPDALPKGRFTIVNITTTDGEKLSKRIDAPKGSPKHPLEFKDLINKLEMYANHTEEAEKFVNTLNQNSDLPEMIKMIGEIR